MQINVAQLLKSSIGAERKYDIDEAIDFQNNKLDVKGEVKLTRTDRGILVDCKINTEVELECCRCLEPFHFPLSIHFEEEYFPTIDVLSGLPLPSSDENAEAAAIDRNHIIDLDDTIRQYALLGIPMKPLCREECAGLCPTCGQNLNRGCCECQVEATDPRLAPLMKLKQKE
jgi:uncharacterized protein